MDEPPAQERRKGGRRRKEKAERRDSFVGFWVTAAEHAAIKSRAEIAGVLAVSSFARAVALGVPIRAPTQSHAYSPELVAQLRRVGNNLNQCLREARFGHFPPEVAAAAEEAIKEVAAALRAQIHAPKY